MTHEELLANISEEIKSAEFEERCNDGGWSAGAKALRAVVELHKPQFNPPGCEDETCCPAFVSCEDCGAYYPCSTIQAIEKELK